MCGCAAKAPFFTAGNNYRNTQEQLSKSEMKCGELQRTLELSGREQAQLQLKTNQLHDENNFLYQKVKELKQTIRKKEIVISLQETVIRLFDDENQTLQKNIQEQIAAQNSQGATTPLFGKLVFMNNLLFRPGTAILSARGKQKLKELDKLLQKGKYVYIRVEGHADSRTLKSTAKYASNWELSALRATTVVQFFQDVLGIAPERMSATGFGHYQPVISNETVEGRRQNSRIEIILK
jgi:chemotaxis protein MotB